jgi:hypothetical protein
MGNITDQGYDWDTFAKAMGDMKDEIANIESQITNPATGLAEIKAEVVAIEGNITDPVFGLEEIKREVAAIEAELANVPRMESYGGTVSSIDDDRVEEKWEFPSVAHITLSIQVCCEFGPGDSAGVYGTLGSPSYSFTFRSDTYTEGIHYYSYEFDAKEVVIIVVESGGDNYIGVGYAMTATYAPAAS